MEMNRGETPAAPLDHAEIRSIIIGIMLAMLLAALDQTIVATAMPTIGRDLGDFEHLPWIVTSYLVASTAVTPLYGKLSDIHGRRITMLVSIGVFLAGSIACAIAPTMLFLILARALQGLGGGGLISLAQTIIADIVSPRERPRYQVLIASVFVSASLIGPVLGGVFAEHLHWSAIFWINVPLGFLALWMTNANLRRLPRHERPHRLDLLGAAVLVSATVSAMLALSWGGTRYGWSSAPILGLFALSALLWVLFGLRMRLAVEPLIPVTVLSNQVVATATGSACFGMGTFIGLAIYVPIYFEVVLGLSARDSGFALTPLVLGPVTGATVSGRVMARSQHYKRLPIAGLGIAASAMTALALYPGVPPLLLLEVLLAMAGLGLGTMLPVSTVATQNAVEPHQLGTATGTMNFFRQLGGAIIVAGFGALVIGHGGTTAGTLPGANAAEVAHAFRWVFAAAAAGLAASLLFMILMQERPLRTDAGVSGPAAPE